MKILVVADEHQEQEVRSKEITPGNEIIFAKEFSEDELTTEYDAIFYLIEKELNVPSTEGTPVFINLVKDTLAQKGLPGNFHRINGWPGFLERSVWEIASINASEASTIFTSLGWNMVAVKDEPGMVAGRVLCTIINEAFFALGENVSTREEIDNAMRLGTNYPYGPFEWMKKIGAQNIYQLLSVLSQRDKRYSVAPLLEKEYRELAADK